MKPTVTITKEGRSGSVRYAAQEGSINGHWEFGGNDVVAIVSMGTMADWRRDHAWAVPQRAAVLRLVAEEVVRQQAPSCTPEIDVERGEVLLRTGAGTATGTADRANAAESVKRYVNLKAMVGTVVLVVALIVGGVLWWGRKALLVAPASGVPLNECVRTDTHIASFIQYMDPHLPRLSGRGGNTTTSISILLIPLDGSGPFVVPVVSGLDGNGYQLARIMGSDGRTLWFDCTGLYGVRLGDHALVSTEDLRKANPSIDPQWWEDGRGMDILDGRLHIVNADRSAAMDVDPVTWKATPVRPKVSNARSHRQDPADRLAAGYITSAGSWCGLHAPGELESTFKVNAWVRPVEGAEDAKRMRRFCTAELEPSEDGTHFRIRRIAPVNGTEYLNAAFLRMDDAAAPLRLNGPESALMVYTDKPGLEGRLVVSRVDTQGKVLWSAATGIDRFHLTQILPGEKAFAFVGTRPPVPGKLSEPIVVLVENAAGTMTVHSLWR